MVLLQRGVLLVVGAGALGLPLLAPNGPTGRPDHAKVTQEDGQMPGPAGVPSHGLTYGPDRKEAYLTAEQVAFIRPGLKATILAVSDFAPSKRPTVEFTLTDDLNQPVDRTGALTPGAVLFRFVPATWDAASNHYTCLIYAAADGRATRDTAGTFQDLEVGHYKYTFALPLVAFDTSRPATMLLAGRRQTTDLLGKDYWANAFRDFLPATGAPATGLWAVSSTARCNTCHDPMSGHGGYFRELKGCVMCHNPASQTGRWTEFNGEGFFHSLHQGTDAEVGPVTYPQDFRHCETCHDSQTAQGLNWTTRPTRASCGGCHLDVNWVTGENHKPGPQLDDAQCATCHKPQGEGEFDVSVTGAHTVPYQSKQLKGLNVTIVSVDQAAPGKKPVLTFKMTNGDGSVVDPTKLNSLAPMMAGTATDFSRYIRESGAQARVAFDGKNGIYTFTAPMPADATGTWAFTLDAYRNVALKRADGDPDIAFRETVMNPVTYVSVTGGTPTPRRTVVTQANCYRCHVRFTDIHGTQRQNVQECVMCHNAVTDDSADRVPKTDTPESVSFQRMIHRIHTGTDLAEEFSLFEGPTKIAFNDVTYPGDRRNCLGCHATAATTQLPPPKGTLSVVTKRDFFSPQAPGTAACLGCHDSRGEASHAFLNTSQIGEACEVCHGANADWSVTKVHAR